jgi:uncharacterized protein YndB with AHSA1/START domain
MQPEGCINGMMIAAKAQMVIRRPVREVFAAFVDPAVTTNFWFTRSSGVVEAGQHLRWDWEMYDLSAEVDVLAVQPNERIAFEWPYGVERTRTTVELTFKPVGDDDTFVTATNFGFSGTAEEIAEQAASSAGGFSFVLAGAKALLEHDIVLNLIADHAPPDA